MRNGNELLREARHNFESLAQSAHDQQLKDYYSDLASRIDAHLAGGGWMPIETAPKDGTIFLGYQNGKYGEAYFVPRDDCEMWHFRGSTGAAHYFPECKPTHWQPLPSLPKETK